MTLLHSRRVRVQVITLVAAVSLWAPANAFWIAGIGHDRLTSAALDGVRTQQPIVGFSARARLQIMLANSLRDLPSRYTDLAHFDNESFTRGGRTVIRYRQAVIRLLLQADQAAAWDRLGYALHTIQDFYAHSSWMEVNAANASAGRLARHFDTTAQDDAARLASFLADIRGGGGEPGCLDDGVSLRPGSNITSGYYSSPFNKTSDLPHFPPGSAVSKCVHLGWTVLVEGPPGCPCAETGFEKDDPTDDRHEAAAVAARRASTEFVQGIVDELQAMGTPAGYGAICRLFDVPIPLCNGALSEPGDGVYRFRNMCVYGLEGVHADTSLNVNGNRTTTTMDQEQRACIETSNLIVTPHVLFCKRNGKWMPKRSVSRHRDDGQPEHILEVREDGTFIGIHKVDHDAVTAAGSRNRLLLNVVARANPTTHYNEGSYRRIEHRFGPTTGGREETWFGYGSGSGGVNPGSEYFVELDPYAPLGPDVEPPSYCYDLDDGVAG